MWHKCTDIPSHNLPIEVKGDVMYGGDMAWFQVNELHTYLQGPYVLSRRRFSHTYTTMMVLLQYFF